MKEKTPANLTIFVIAMLALALSARAQETAPDIPAVEEEAPVEAEAPAVVEEVVEPEVEIAAPDVPVVEDEGLTPADVTMAPTEKEMPAGLSVEETDDSDLISVKLEAVALVDVISIFSSQSDASIIIPSGLEEITVTANLHDVNWRVGLEAILETKNFVLLEKRPGIFTIASTSELEAAPMSRETLDLKYITPEDAVPIVQNLLVSSNANVTPVRRSNKLIIVEAPHVIREIREILELTDVPRKQVFIESKFVVLNDQAAQSLGINWQVLQGYTVGASQLTRTLTQTDRETTQDAEALFHIRNRDSQSAVNIPDGGPSANTSSRSETESVLNGVVQGRNFTDIDSGSLTTEPVRTEEIITSAVLGAGDFAVTLSALKELDGVEVVSNPKLLVANGETANLHSGDQEPNIQALPQGENVTSFAYQLNPDQPWIETGIKLEVTPIINTEKNIELTIIPSLSQVVGEKTVGEANTSFPVISINRVTTRFAVGSGKTVAIGGLSETLESEVVKKVPVLGDIPVVGKYLFQHTTTRKDVDEIIIFVTVQMAHPDTLDDSRGIPQHGELIHTWLKNNESEQLDVGAETRTADEIMKEYGM